MPADLWTERTEVILQAGPSSPARVLKSRPLPGPALATLRDDLMRVLREQVRPRACQ
jgi:hypothetical protein